MCYLCVFFFTDPATSATYILSLHDALPICDLAAAVDVGVGVPLGGGAVGGPAGMRDTGRSVHRRTSQDRKSTRLNSSHTVISYAVFCLKKKKHYKTTQNENLLVTYCILTDR